MGYTKLDALYEELEDIENEMLTCDDEEYKLLEEEKQMVFEQIKELED